MTSNKVILKGKEAQLKPIITQLMALHQLLDERDIGSWTGYPINEYYRKAPQTGISVKVILTTFKRPPFYQIDNRWFSRRQVSIPMVDKSKLTYEAIRNACGGSNGQDWGEYKARAFLGELDNPKGIYQMAVGGSTEAIAMRNLNSFSQFTQLHVKSVSVSKEDYNNGFRAKLPNKEKYNNFEVYPAFITITNTKLVNYTDQKHQGRATTSGRELLKRIKLNIYREKEPDNWDEQLREVLRRDFDIN
jgi:hypothetical protein